MKSKKLWIIIILILAVGAGYYYWKQTQTKKSAIAQATVKVQRGDISFTISSTGSISPQNRVEIKPPISGRIESILVNEGDSVRKGQVLAWMSSTERAALLDAARTKGREEVSRWEDLYKATPIIAPITGSVIARSVNPGQTVGPADPVVVVSDRLIVRVQVDETDIAKIKLGQAATILLDAYRDKPISARVDHIAYEAKTVNNVTIYEVEVLPSQTMSFFRSGMSCNVVFQIASKENVLLVPVSAVTQKGKHASVNSGGKQVRVEVGLSDGKNIEILEGLIEGDEISMAQVQLSGGRQGQRSSNPLTPRRPNRR